MKQYNKFLLLYLISLTINCFGHETDQYTVPIGHEYADLKFLISKLVYKDLNTARKNVNKHIKRALKNNNSYQIKKWTDPYALVSQFYSHLPSFVYHIHVWEYYLRTQSVTKQFPGKLTTYLPTFWLYHNPLLMIDITKIVRLIPASTIMIDGHYLGTDKLSHFFDMGYFYYESYNKSVMQGLSKKKAIKKAVQQSTGYNLFFSENMLLGGLTTGVHSYADLAANYLGFKFYRNFSESLKLKGKLYPPIFIKKGSYWEFNRNITATNDFFSKFISPHFDEVLNPNGYMYVMRPVIRLQIKKRCDALTEWYSNHLGVNLTKTRVKTIQDSLVTYYGEDYGHNQSNQSIVSVTDICSFKKQTISQDEHEALLAIMYYDNKKLNRLLENNKKLILREDQEGETLLHKAVRVDNVKATSLLISKGANVNSTSKFLMTPLHLAVLKTNKSAVRLLLKSGAKKETKDIFGRTPLDNAVFRQSDEIKRLLKK